MVITEYKHKIHIPKLNKNPGVMLKTPGLSFSRIPLIQAHKPGAVAFEKQSSF